jgi:hypothetical protein
MHLKHVKWKVYVQKLLHVLNKDYPDRGGRAIAQAVNRWLPIAAARIQTRV